ncbi:MAG: tetratricopeptide repeat protein [Pseudomonadales bacterium]|uniref:TPR repeat-containing protein n=1 Tax=Oleiphilus messinensis TaxID=141451 RepID=A0A1Y0I7X4_9GAMM|nr:tetratricopeptide repeat protein [Oleiphilus messinensis]ARU55595.1 TPR repeat-containing protein [Oleiphilus messinensis]MCG8613896.1 tetratricopeptide repeat protein [Pseudomonadales bacterium]
MPVLALLLLVIQIAFAVHAVKTGRDTFWVYIIIFVPAIGCAVYFFTQVLPDLQQSRTVRSTGNSLLKAIDPQRELRRRKENLEIADTQVNRLQLADECVEAELYDEAIALYESCLQGFHKTNPAIMLKLAQACFQAHKNDRTKQILESLIQENPDFKSADGHLLYARALENLHLLDAALEEYRVLAETYPGEEGRVRYGLLLMRMNRQPDAHAVFENVLLRAKRSHKFYRKKEAKWIAMAQDNAN